MIFKKKITSKSIFFILYYNKLRHNTKNKPCNTQIYEDIFI